MSDTDKTENNLHSELERLKAENELLRRENALLKEKVDLLIRRIFGVKSEKLDAAQLELLLEQAQAGTSLGKAEASVEAEAAPIVELLKARRRDKHQREARERWPEELPVIEEILEPEEVKANPEEFRCIGEEVSEQLDYQPAKFFRRQIIRRKFVSRREPELAPVIAPAPESLQQRCIAAPGLLAQIIVSKYCDHLPFYAGSGIKRSMPGGRLCRSNEAAPLSRLCYARHSRGGAGLGSSQSF